MIDRQDSRLLATFALLATAILACELGLHLAARWSRTAHGLLMPPWERASPIVPDDRLGARGNPYHPEHDVAGYRNRIRPGQADIVVLGDSHAYGSGIAEPWPARLGAYNMALPSYGPGQGLLQLEEALAFKPRLLVVAPYFGNDFYDTYLLSRRQPALVARLAPKLRAAADAAERRAPLERERADLFGMGIIDPAAPRGGRGWVSNHVRLYGLVRTAWFRLTPKPAIAILSPDFASASAALTPMQRRYATPIEAGGWRTILAAPYRAWALDDRDPRIRLGFEAAVEALRVIHVRAVNANVRMLVVLLPTKESVFWPRVRTPVLGLSRLVEDEARLRAELVAALAADNIPYVDVLPSLRSAAAQPYFESIDGHPNVEGHRVIAEAVRAQRQTESRPRRRRRRAARAPVLARSHR